jgi:tetratricopeptide (TPR) repeat protein
LLLALAGSGRVHAQQRDRREVHAQELFALGRYADALGIYGKLYAETNHPTYLRNIGRCYQNMGEPDKAIASFREYLRHAKRLPDDQRAVIDGYIREMQDLKAKREEEAARPPPPPKAPEPPPPDLKPSPPLAPAPRPIVGRVPGPAHDGEAPAEGHGMRRTAAYVVAGVSLIALGTGAYFGVQAIRDERSSKNLCADSPCSNTRGLSLNHTASTEARVADFTIGGGLVGAGVATFLYLTGGAPARGEPTAQRPRVAPQIAGDRIGLAASGTW